MWHTSRVRSVVSTVLALPVILASQLAFAAPPDAELMRKLAVHAARFEEMKTHASYALEGKLERLDGDGKPDQVKEMRARVDADGARAKFNILSYLEDGEDKTEEARTKQREREADKKRDKREFKMPFHAGSQARYLFDQVEVDKVDPSRVRISFVPKERAQDTIEGSAWVDAQAGTVLSAGFKLSKTPAFVDYVHITVEFGEATSLGPAVSKVRLAGGGGFLFFHKRFRAEATMREYRIAP
jgi:hypothetical protein